MNGPEDEIERVLTTYNELNSCAIETLHEEPSPLEFMRYVARNTPFVVRGAAADWKAAQRWSADYLKQALRDVEVNVAVTPFGNADSPTRLPNGDGRVVFAKPHEEDQPFGAFLDHLVRQEMDTEPDTDTETDPSSSSSPSQPSEEVRYAQTQNDNLPHEYATLAGDVPADIPFARIALDRRPDATNLWVGNSRSVTALHKDNYENIYVQVLGQKHFVLLPPVCSPCVNEQNLPPATYVREAGGGLVLVEDDAPPDDEEEEEEEELRSVPFATWDPDRPEVNATKYSSLVKPVRVTLSPGDMLYLPAMWYHKVSQTGSADEGICVAVNYWYDMEFSGPLYCLDTLVRSVNRRRCGEGKLGGNKRVD